MNFNSTGVTDAQIRRWHNYPNGNALARDAAEWVSASAARAIESRNAFHIVLSGGNTPKGIYECLKSTKNTWAKWHIYYGDERCLPLDDSNRNSTLASVVWLKYVPIPVHQIYTIPAELGPDSAAKYYADVLKKVALFDLCLLGLGEDGHTASLFPGNDVGDSSEAPAVLAVKSSPKPPPQRVSLSAYRLSQSREVLVCVSGASKEGAVARWRAGEALPIAAINPENGLDVLVSKLT